MALSQKMRDPKEDWYMPGAYIWLTHRGSTSTCADPESYVPDRTGFKRSKGF